MSKKLSRRDFARTSVAAGAAAVAVPGALFGTAAASESAAAATAAAAGKQAAIARRLITPPAQGFGYGGGDIAGRGVSEPLQDAAGAPQAAPVTYPGGWREGHTIPAEYYIDEKHYLADERFIGNHLWLMVDHESRIPNAGDYFVFEYGRGESVIVLRDRAGAVKAYYNVCRHRGSRLCRHDEDPTPKDTRLSVKQLASEWQHTGLPVPLSRLELRPRRAPGVRVRHAGRFRRGAERAHALSCADRRGLHLREPLTAGAARFHIGRQRDADALSALRNGAAEGRGAHSVPDEGQLEAGARELPGVLSLRPRAPLAGHHPRLGLFHHGRAEGAPGARDGTLGASAGPAGRNRGHGTGGGSSIEHRGSRFPAARLRHRIARWQTRGAAPAQLQGVHPRLQGDDDRVVDGILGGLRRSRRRRPLHAAWRRHDRCGDHLAGQPGGERGEGLPDRPADGAVGHHHARGQVDRREQPPGHPVWRRLRPRALRDPRSRQRESGCVHQVVHDGRGAGGGKTDRSPHRSAGAGARTEN